MIELRKNALFVIILLTFSAMEVEAGQIVIFEDDGSGFNPNTSLQNNWIPDNPSTWSIGTTVQDVASNPVFSGSQAASDMVSTLGASNQVITANVIGTGISTLSLDPFPFTTMGGQQFEFSFFQTVSDQTATDGMGADTNTTFIFDNFRMDVEDKINGGFFLWLWMDMFTIKEVLLEIDVEVQKVRFIHTDKSIVTTVVETILVPGIEFIPMGSVHFHTMFDPTEPPELTSDATITSVPEPGTYMLLAIGLIGLVFKFGRSKDT